MTIIHQPQLIYAVDKTIQERLRFLMSIIPTLSVYGAMQHLRNFEVSQFQTSFSTLLLSREKQLGIFPDHDTKGFIDMNRQQLSCALRAPLSSRTLTQQVYDNKKT